MIEVDVLARLDSIAARTGLSKSEQIRQGIRWWLDSREWPDKDAKLPRAGGASSGPSAPVRPKSGKRQ